MPIHDLSGKVVLLTGIGAIAEVWGNGTTFATVLARQGAKVYGCDLNIDAADKAVKELRQDSEIASRGKSSPGQSEIDVFPESCDVTKLDRCKALVDACMSKHGRIDILVNNVGKSEPGGPAEMSEETWDSQTDVNLKSVYLMCHLVLPIMESQATGGAILNVGSVAGMRYIGKPQVAYAACKAAIVQFIKTTAVIYAQRTGGKVRLNTVIPGLINTPLVEVLANKYAKGDYEGFKTTRDAQVPTGKMGTPWDVAYAGLYLASDEAKYVTGQEIVVDGGVTVSTGRI